MSGSLPVAMSPGEVPRQDYRHRFEQYKALETQKDALITVSQLYLGWKDDAANYGLHRSFLTAWLWSKASVMLSRRIWMLSRMLVGGCSAMFQSSRSWRSLR
jgi:hypothetical protein